MAEFFAFFTAIAEWAQAVALFLLIDAVHRVGNALESERRSKR